MDKKKTHYLVQGLFWRGQMHDESYQETKKEKLCHITKTFANDDLYAARQEAFANYQSLIDVLYDALGEKYTTDQQARIDLQAFLNAGCDSSVTRIGKMTFDDNILNEIAVYWVHNGKKRLIHGIAYRPDNEKEESDKNIATMGRNLVAEHNYYEHYNIPFPYDCLCDMTDLSLGFQFVLDTPFDWDGFAKENLLRDMIKADLKSADPNRGFQIP